MRRLIGHLTYGALLATSTMIPKLAYAQAPGPGAYASAGEVTAEVADAYFKAYIELDWDALEPYLAEGASFADPTAELVFGNPQTQGREAIMAKFRKGYAGIKEMHFDRDRVIHSGNLALYEGRLGWTLHFRDGNVLNSEMPYVAIIRVEDGKVVSHLDYGDYSSFIAGVQALKSPGEGG